MREVGYVDSGAAGRRSRLSIHACMPRWMQLSPQGMQSAAPLPMQPTSPQASGEAAARQPHGGAIGQQARELGELAVVSE